MQIRRSVAGLALAGSAFAGGLVLGPTMASAQEDPPEQEDGNDPNRERPGPCRGPHRGRFLAVAAEAIGIEADALRDALEGGQTIAQVAQANGVEAQAVVDALVDAVSTRIDEAVAEGRLTQEEADQKKAELPERMTALVNGQRPEGFPPRGGPRGDPGRSEDPEEPEEEEPQQSSAANAS
jgi:hypothetical protein